jgi:hypothetical protein
MMTNQPYRPNERGNWVMKRNQTITIAIILMSLALWTALTALTVGAQDITPQIWPSAEVAEAVAGQEFTVSIRVTGASQVYGSSFQLAFDPTAFEIVLVNEKVVTTGEFFNDGPSFALKNTVDATSGVIDFALTLTQPALPVTGDGVIGTLRFRALKDAPVAVSLVSPTLVSPEFTEIDGRLVAQKINQVDAVTAEMTVGDPPAALIVDSAETASASVAVALPGESSAIQPLAGESASASVSVGNVPSPILTEEHRAMPSNKVLLVAGLFFIGGLLLLTMSVGMYSKMRVRLSLAGNYPPERMR